MKTALVTGSQGFVGRHFVQHLAAEGWDVHGIDLFYPELNLPGQDALQYFATHQRQFDLVVHAAAAGPNRKAIDAKPMNFAYNLMLDAAMFDWAHRTTQPRVVYLSSCAVYSDDLTRGTYGQHPFVESRWGIHPFDRYGMTKRTGEQMAQALNEAGGTRVTVVRPFSGYGSDQSTDFPFGAFIERARNREDPFKIWGSGNQVRDWIHIDDIVRGTMTLVDAGVTTPTNLCTGLGTSMIALARMVCLAADYDPIYACDATEPNGVMYRVGDTEKLHDYYTPKVTLFSAIRRALEGK